MPRTPAPLIGAFVVAATILLAAPALAADERLSFSHFMPVNSWQNETLFADWARAVEDAAAGSGAELEITVFPAQMLGRAERGYDNARDGITDIAWTVPGYTPGRFPLAQIIELPGLFDRAEVGSCAFQKLYDSGALDAEFAEVRVLFVHTHGPGHLHTRNRAVTRLSDLAGLKIRRPSPVIGELLAELGAEPVGMPAPQIYEATSRGTIDGYMLPWEAVAGFRLDEVSAHHTVFGFYSLAFLTVMSAERYAGLSAPLQAAIDAQSGMAWARAAGRGFDAGDRRGLEVARASGNLHEIAGEERAAWEAAAAQVTENTLARMEASGLPARETYAAVQRYVSACEAEIDG
ncbi:MAG: TRAP transporter substrate-binding protein [Pikeienuella sp.]